MKKAIAILKSHILGLKSQVEIYEANPHNQAVTEYSAKEAASGIVELQSAITALESLELAQLSHNSESVKLPSETLVLSKCSLFDKCPATGKGHAGCYSEAPCFGQ